MATIEHWNKYMNLLHEMALVEDDLRTIANDRGRDAAQNTVAEQILFERFGVMDANTPVKG